MYQIEAAFAFSKPIQKNRLLPWRCKPDFAKLFFSINVAPAVGTIKLAHTNVLHIFGGYKTHVHRHPIPIGVNRGPVCGIPAGLTRLER